MREDETSLFFCILLDLSSNLGNIEHITETVNGLSIIKKVSLKKNQIIIATLNSERLSAAMTITGTNYNSILTDAYDSANHCCIGNATADTIVSINISFYRSSDSATLNVYVK